MKLSDIEIEPCKGWWVVKDHNNKRQKATKNTFLFFLRESGVSLEAAMSDPMHLPNKDILQKRFDFYYLQIDPEKSDMFALNMFPAKEWEL